jgi:hypothetical protein
MPPTLRRLIVLLLMLGLVAGISSATPASAGAATAPAPPTPKGLPAAIEGMARYVPETTCDPHIRPGTRKLATLLAHTYAAYGATHWASTYACGTDGSPSEHYDGRAIDWMVDIHNTKQHAAATAFLAWLLAADKAGDAAAMARRLGVMYVIYDNRMWGSWGGGWEDYNGCEAKKMQAAAYANSCHRTHVHISLSWDGAYGRTSYWTKKVATRTDYGPCRPKDLNWAWVYTTPNYAGCPHYPTVTAAKGASATKKALVTYSGAAVHSGSQGPAVTAVQRALHVSASGSFGASTTRAVKVLQTAHHLPASGVMNPATWRALLARTT